MASKKARIGRLSDQSPKLSGEKPNSPSAHLDPRVQRTRTLLEDAFLALRAERHYSGISISDITKRAGLSRATFYAHYRDYPHFVSEMLRHELRAAIETRVPRGSPLNVQTLGAFGTALFEFMDEFARRYARVDSEQQRHTAFTLQEATENYLTAWIQRERDLAWLFPNANPESVITALAWTLYGGATRWSRLKERPYAAQTARELVALLVH